MTTEMATTGGYAGLAIPRLGRVCPSDLTAVTRLFAALHAHNAALDPRFALADGWEEILRAHVARTNDSDAALWLLAWAGAEPVGLLAVEAHQDSPLFRHRGWAELVALYVAPSWRRTGLARRLVDEARVWSAAHGFDRLQLYVTATNEPARRLYTRCGLRPVQEIWRLDVVPRPGITQPEDPLCAATQQGGDLLESGHHHLAIDAVVRADARPGAGGRP